MADLLTNLADLFDYKEYDGDLDEKEYGLAIMMLLQDFTKKYSSKPYSYIEKHFDDDCKRLEEKSMKMQQGRINYWLKMFPLISINWLI